MKGGTNYMKRYYLDDTISYNKPIKIMGLDVATLTGVSILNLNSSGGTLDAIEIKMQGKGEEKLQFAMDVFCDLILNNNPDVCIIEDTFLHYKFGNVTGFKQLTRLNTIPAIICMLTSIPYHYILANSARSNLNIKYKSKDTIIQYVNTLLSTDIDNDNIADATVLALNYLYGHFLIDGDLQ